MMRGGFMPPKKKASEGGPIGMAGMTRALMGAVA
jgi:hypothetical protein